MYASKRAGQRSASRAPGVVEERREDVQDEAVEGRGQRPVAVGEVAEIREVQAPLLGALRIARGVPLDEVRQRREVALAEARAALPRRRHAAVTSRTAECGHDRGPV